MESWKNHKLDWICISEYFSKWLIVLNKTYEETKQVLKENYPDVPEIYWDIEIAMDTIF